MIENLFNQWWVLTVQTYELIWPAIPFALAYGIWRGWKKMKR